jgi:Flp pilus assembly pilin Flp
MSAFNYCQNIFAAARLRLVDDTGQVMVEYALILALLSVVSIGVLRALGTDISNLLTHLSSRMSSVTNP